MALTHIHKQQQQQQKLWNKNRCACKFFFALLLLLLPLLLLWLYINSSRLLSSSRTEYRHGKTCNTHLLTTHWPTDSKLCFTFTWKVDSKRVMFYPSCLHGPSRCGPNSGWLVAVGASFWRLLLPMMMVMMMRTMWQFQCLIIAQVKVGCASTAQWRRHSLTIRYLWLDCQHKADVHRWR